MLSELLTRPVTISTPAGAGTNDAYGNENEAADTVTTVCELQQRQRTEDGETGVATGDWLLFLPAGTVLKSSSTVTVDGVTYEVVGDPWPVWDPFQQDPSHIEATLRRTAGADTA